MPDPPRSELRVACDAMCGGLARWLRMLGVDTAYKTGIDDASLVQLARRDARTVITSDRRLLERRVFTRAELRGLLMPHGLPLREQVRWAVGVLGIAPREPRCTACNGVLELVPREQVADRVPARSLLWGKEFRLCLDCGQVFWQGTHWARIAAVLRELPPRDDSH